jgi:hypothetical protein
VITDPADSGGKGDDVAFLGGGFDRFSWKPGDSSDVVDGGPSRDSLSFQGANVTVAGTARADTLDTSPFSPGTVGLESRIGESELRQ